MADRLTWLFELTDKMSGPAGKITAALDKQEKKLRAAAAATDAIEKKYSKTLGAVRGLADGVWGLGRSLAYAGLGLGALGAGIAATLGKVAYKAATFAEDTKTSLSMVSGSTAEAARSMDLFRRFADASPFRGEPVFEWGVAAKMAGRTDEDTLLAMKFASDVGLLKGGKNPDAAMSAMNMLLRTETGSPFGMGDVASLEQMGLQRQVLLEAFAKRLNVQGGAWGARAMLETGTVTGHTASNAIIDALEAQLHAPVGELTARRSRTVSGRASTLESRLGFDLFQGVEKSQGWKTLNKVLDTINEVLNPDGATGKKIMKGITTIADKLGEMLEPLKDPKTVTAWFDALDAGINKALPGMAAIGRVFYGIGKLTGQSLEGLGYLGDLGSDLANGLTGGVNNPKDLSPTGQKVLGAMLGAPGQGAKASGITINVDARGASDPEAIRKAAEHGVRSGARILGSGIPSSGSASAGY